MDRRTSGNIGYGILAGLALVVMTSCSTSRSIINHITNYHKNKSKIEATTIEVNNSYESKQNLERIIAKQKSQQDSLLTASIISEISKYRPEIKPMPTTTIIGGDTLHLSYELPGGIDSSMIEHNLIVRKNALRMFPHSKSYLGYIFQACDDYRNIFPIPSETIIALIVHESNFNQYAVSIAPAFGMNQFMRGTAIDMRMHVYSESKFPRLAKAEMNLARLTREYSRLDNTASRLFHSNNFKEAEKYEIIADSAYVLLRKAITEFEVALSQVDRKKLDDDRLRPEICISAGVKYLAILARSAKNKFKCSDEQAIDWAIEAYNAGFGSLDYMRPVAETAGYARGINKLESRLYPQSITPMINTRPVSSSRAILNNVSSRNF